MTSSYWNPAGDQPALDWKSAVGYTPSVTPSTSTAYDTSWSSLPSWSSPESYPSTLPLPPAPSQQPFDWGAAIAASKDLLGGIAGLIGGIRGVPVGYGGQPMAGSNLTSYLQAKKEDAYLTDLLENLRKGNRADTDPDLSPLKTANIFGSSSFG